MALVEKKILEMADIISVSGVHTSIEDVLARLAGGDCPQIVQPIRRLHTYLLSGMEVWKYVQHYMPCPSRGAFLIALQYLVFRLI